MEVSFACNADVAGGRLTVSGGREADKVRMRDDGQGNILVHCAGGDEVQATGVRRIVLRTEGGDDDVGYSLEPAHARIARIAPADLEIDLGARR